MGNNNYSEERKKHLAAYADASFLSDKMGGTHKGGDKQYEHIIKVKSNIDKDDQYKKVVLYNLLDGVKPDMLKKEKLHSMAHYLTSSQIVCYNYFRPLLDDAGHPNDKFLGMLKTKGIILSSAAIGEFEYNAPEYGKDGRREHTEFDFHLFDSTTGTEVFFEIKYTEQNFGKWGKYSSEKNFDNFYRDLFSMSYALRPDIPSLDAFSNSFQLYRNALRVRRSNQYSIFVFPKANTGVYNEYMEFKKKVIEKESNVFAWTWEELIDNDHDTEFYHKYFAL